MFDDYIKRKDAIAELSRQECMEVNSRVVRRSRQIIEKMPAADVVPNDFFNKVYEENTRLRELLDMYGGEAGIKAVFEERDALCQMLSESKRCVPCQPTQPECGSCEWAKENT